MNENFITQYANKYYNEYNILGKIIHFPILICCGLLFFLQSIFVDIIDILDYLFPTKKHKND